MRLSVNQIKKLQKLLKEQYNLDYTDEQTYDAGLAIMRFVLSKKSLSLERNNSND